MAVRLRSEQRSEEKWKIEDLYASDDIWQKDYDRAEQRIKAGSAYEGKLSESALSLAGVLSEYDELENLVERLYVYANMKYYEDMGNGTYQALAGKAQNLISAFSAAYSFVEPQLLAINDDALAEFMKQEIMAPYRQYVADIVRQKEHILSAEMERVMADASKLAQAPKDIFGSFNNADIRFGDIMDENGQLTELTQGRYVHFMESRNRSVRKAAYDRLYDSYGGFINTLASCYHANVTQAVFFARQRKFKSTLESALDSANIPVAVYDGLIEAVNSHLELMHRYVRIRKKALGLDSLHMYDVYAPLVENVEMKVPYEKAKEIVAEGLMPLGEEYASILQNGYETGWIDVYENQGKRTGAFSWGAYGTHPYVFMNYQENLDSVFTLAHEMGHAIHTYKSNEHQPHMYAGYRIFVAEVASTCNEALLIRHLIARSTDKKEKAYLINHFMEQFKGTMFRQTMFAEFEKETHAMAENGQILTAEVLNGLYKSLNEKYFGNDMVIDDKIAMEWARIPHFYTPFYVYQYATGFAAAVTISQKILEQGEPAVKGYMDFLSSGSSDYPIEVLKKAGVDMTKTDALDGAFQVFDRLLDEFEGLL
jgi:oligoendopeptidase F